MRNRFPTFCLPVIALAASVSWSENSRADWAWSRWGATPEETVAMSGGKATFLFADEDPLNGAERPFIGLLPQVHASHVMGSATFDVIFLFDAASEGLSCVELLPRSYVMASEIKDRLVTLYGAPVKSLASPQGGANDTKLTWVGPRDVAFLRYGAKGTGLTVCAKSSFALKPD